MELSEVIETINNNPQQKFSYYQFPQLYDFFHSKNLNRDTQVKFLEKYQPKETDSVLELGCGTGPLLKRIEHTYDTVIGIDKSRKMLAKAKEKTDTADLIAANFIDLSFSKKDFDIIFLPGGFLHINEDLKLQKLSETIFKNLRDGGVFLTFFTPFTSEIQNVQRDFHTAFSERYSVTKQTVTVLTSEKGDYNSTHIFNIYDSQKDKKAEFGSIINGRYHRPEKLRKCFLNTGFKNVQVKDEAETTLLVVKK